MIIVRLWSYFFSQKQAVKNAAFLDYLKLDKPRMPLEVSSLVRLNCRTSFTISTAVVYLCVLHFYLSR